MYHMSDTNHTTPQPSSPHASISAAEIAAAAQRRASAVSPSSSDPLNELKLHEKRQHFRRLIDPGILRPNPKEVAMASLKILSALAENLLREPDNPKYQRFKSTNDTIKHRLIEPKGTLEYAIALGFEPQVENMQPYYVFNPRKMDDAAMGCAILKEVLAVEKEKHDRAERAKREEKAAKDAVFTHVKLAFLDDRKSKQVLDQREKERRAAQAAHDAVRQANAAAYVASLDDEVRASSQAASTSMPGVGNVLRKEASSDIPPEDD